LSDINKYLGELRKRRGYTLREAAERSGLSHSYISSLESGVHPKTKAPIKPSPETLERLSKAYNENYEELMIVAGYLEENKKENAAAFPKSKLDLAVEKIERDLDVSIRDDPEIMEALESYLRTLGKMKKK
jgi:transcriptional regulator with XRE-family HTH domain